MTLGCLLVLRRSSHRVAAYCALLAMMCQLLLPFAHAAVMAQAQTAAWCGTGPQPKMAWSGSNSQDTESAESGKMMFCPVCASVGAQAFVPQTDLIVLPLPQITTLVEFETNTGDLSYASFAVPPPPRGPPLIS